MAIEDIIPVRFQDDKLFLLDQTELPAHDEFHEAGSIEELWYAIKMLAVRGAPAIGVAAGYGMYIKARDYVKKENISDEAEPAVVKSFITTLEEAKAYLDSSRPTAVNLSWALNMLDKTAQKNRDKTVPEIVEALHREAVRIQEEDIVRW